LSIDLFEEVQELGRPVAPVALADDEARGDIEGGEQRGRPVPHVVVRPPFGDARHHRQDRLFAVQGLDLAHMGNSQVKTFGSGRFRLSWQISVGCFVSKV